MMMANLMHIFSHEHNDSNLSLFLSLFSFFSGKLMAKQSVALECLSYHATASHDDTERLRRDDIPSSEYYNLYR
jgi:hypothetical protein